MPLPGLGSPFRKVLCKQCGWHEVFYSPGDVVLLPNDCQNCEGESLEIIKPSAVESMLCNPVEFINYQLRLKIRR
jgi:hypothetical protein